MRKHDYYADLTVFDHLHTQLGSWLSGHSAGLRAYGWSAGFAILGLSSFLVASGLLAWGLQIRWFSDLPVSIDDALVRTVTVLLALFASSQLFKQSIRALPQDFPLPAFFFSGRHRIELLVISSLSTVAPFTLVSAALLDTVDLVAIVALVMFLSGGLILYRQQRSRVSGKSQLAGLEKMPVRESPAASPSPVDDGRGIQDFLSRVRAAGVNVSIARALFTAGIRSEKHLRSVDDAKLLGIHGVGPVTVGKLRACFRQSQ